MLLIIKRATCINPTELSSQRQMDSTYRIIEARNIEQTLSNGKRPINEVAQLTRGDYLVRTEAVYHEDVTYFRRFTLQSLREIGFIPEDHVCFTFHPQESDFYLKGSYYGKGGISTINSGQPWESISKSNTTQYSIIINKNSLAKYFNAEQREAFSLFCEKKFDITSSNKDYQQPIFRIIDRVLHYLNVGLVTVEEERYLQDTREDIMFFMANLIGAMEFDDLRINSNAKLLDKSLEFINQHIEQKFTIFELAERLHTHRRNLELAFNYYLGISPREYVNNIKMNMIRKCLVTSTDPKLNISEVANNFGISHMGNFSQSYSKLFGELPSDTMKRTRAAQQTDAKG